MWLCEVWGKPSQFLNLLLTIKTQNQVSVYNQSPNLAKPPLQDVVPMWFVCQVSVGKFFEILLFVGKIYEVFVGSVKRNTYFCI